MIIILPPPPPNEYAQVTLLSVSPCRPLLIHHGAARPVTGEAGPRAVAVVGVPGGVALVARPGRVRVVVVVMVFPGRGCDFLPVVVAVPPPLWLGPETHCGTDGAEGYADGVMDRWVDAKELCVWCL